MNQAPIGLLIALFQAEGAADEALRGLKSAQKAHLLAVQDAAVIRRDEDGNLHIKETADPGGGKGAVAGGVIGAIIGLLGGPGGAIVAGAAGALVGGVTAKVIDSGIPDARLEAIGQQLAAGSSALVAIVEHGWLEAVQRHMVEAGAEVTRESLRRDFVEQARSAGMAEETPDATN